MFEKLLNLKTAQFEITQASEKCYAEMLEEDRILLSCNFNFKKTQLLLPNQDTSNNDYVILLQYFFIKKIEVEKQIKSLNRFINNQ